MRSPVIKIALLGIDLAKKMWNHGIVPSPWDDRGALYLVFGAGQLSAGYRYMTE
jgi:hypothetical protein